MERPALPHPRPRRSRRLLAAAGAGALIVLGACAHENDPIVDGGPADPPTEVLDQRIVARIETGGGLAESPQGPTLGFELHDDGAVFTASDDGAFGLDRYRLSSDGVERARELLAGIELDGDAYGEPGITDMPSTSVYVNLDGEPAALSIYALTDLDDFGDSGLSGGEQAARGALLAVLDELAGLAGDPALVDEPPAPYEPGRLDVAFVPWAPSDDGSAPEALAWPLDTPLTDRTLGWDRLRLCATVEGDEVGALTAAMAIDAPGAQYAPWSTGAAEGAGLPTTVAAQVRGLRPGQEACTDRPEPEVASDPPLLDAGPLYTVELADPAGWPATLPADSFRRAEPLEVYAAVPAVAEAVAADAVGLSDTDLTWYDYRAVVAVAGGATYLDLEARPTAGSIPEPGEPTTWRARTDLTTGEVTTIEAD